MKIISLPLLFYCVLAGQTNHWNESLIYNAYFGGIHIAEGQLKISEPEVSDEKPVIQILFQAKTISTANFIFPINDKINIDINPKTWTPISIKKVIREGKYKHDSFTQFFPEKNIFIYKNDTISYVPPVHDPYSLIYLFRRKKLTPGMNSTRLYFFKTGTGLLWRCFHESRGENKVQFRRKTERGRYSQAVSQ